MELWRPSAARAQNTHLAHFQTAVAVRYPERAMANYQDLWRWSKPLLKKRRVDQPERPNGLICLKGGDLAQEIFESGCKPLLWEIEKVFPEKFFADKYLLYVPSK